MTDEEMEEDTDTFKRNVKSTVKPRDKVWHTTKLENTKVHASLWVQPPFSPEVDTPMYCINSLEKPNNVYPRIDINFVAQDEPSFLLIKVGWLQKRGKTVKKLRQRYFQLTSNKALHYWEDDTCKVLKGYLILFFFYFLFWQKYKKCNKQKKGTIDLSQMEQCVQDQSDPKWIHINTGGRKWQILCKDMTEAGDWTETINELLILCFFFFFLL